jgi:guanylate kinase
MTTPHPVDRQHKVVILSGPSGVGKAALKKRVIELAASEPNLPTYSMLPLLYSRQPRNGELDGHEYRFVTDDEIARYDDSAVFKRRLYSEYWQAVRFQDLEAAFASDAIRILELPRLLALDVRSKYRQVRSVLLSPVPIPSSWNRVLELEAAEQLATRLRIRAQANGDSLTEAELELRIAEGIALLHAAQEYDLVLVMPMAPGGPERDEIVERLARSFMDFTADRSR